MVLLKRAKKKVLDLTLIVILPSTNGLNGWIKRMNEQGEERSDTALETIDVRCV